MRLPLSSSAVVSTLLALLPVASPAASSATPTRPPASDTPGALVLVLDASGSMAEPAGGGTSRIEAARTALGEVIDALPDDQEVALRVFGAEVEFADQPGACQDSQRVVDLGTDNRDDLRAAVDSYRPFGETPTGYALQQAGDDLGVDGQRSIILVSDGEPTCAPDPCAVARQLVRDGVDVRIDVVGLSVSGAAREQLQCVADAGRGTYYDADDADEIVSGLTTSAARAARPFDLTGTPVQGTAAEAGAPTIGPGQWLDTMPADGGRFYRLTRSVPGSTLHVGMVTRSRPDATTASARLTLLPADGGTSCASEPTIGVVLGMRNPLLLGGVSSAVRDPGAACNTDPTLLLEIEHATGAPEPLAGQPLEIAVYEEPPLADPGNPPAAVAPLDDGAWVPMTPEPRPTEVVPGTSLASAPVIGEGSWSADIQPGEAQVFAVPVDWGQDVQFQLDTRVTPEAAAAAAVGSDLGLTVVGPVRSRDEVDYYAQEPPSWTTTAFGNIAPGTPFRIGARSQPVGYDHRFALGAEAGSSVAGLRYVQVAYNVRGDDANLPYTLTVRVNGEPGAGAPEYDESAGLPVPAADSPLVGDAVADDDSGAVEPREDDAGADDAGSDASGTVRDEGSGTWTLVAGGAGALFVLALVAVVVRRRRTAPPG
ncbi:VWA domain-containing protein [Nocardioides sp. C4-1]|uniref:vWA domain-containing protein n=1 Tax=Nocardioides sp. C4-1 TaxID=3151851 RepID=UPI0032675194